MLGMTGDDRAPVAVRDADGSEVLAPYYAFDRKGLTLVDSDYLLRTEGGYFYASATKEYLAPAIKNGANQLTVAIRILPRVVETAAPATIAAYGELDKEPLLEIWQKGKEIGISLNAGEVARSQTLLTLENAKPLHLAVIITPEAITWYRDAVEVGKADGFKGDTTAWPAGIVFFGNAASESRPWLGEFEFFEFHNQALDAAAITKLHEAAVKEIGNRLEVEPVTIEGTLLARSEYPKPWDPGFTYTEVLSICEYKVDKVISGDYKGEKMRIAEWMFVDRIFLTNSQKAIGSKHTLTVVELDQQPQLATTEQANTLELDIDADVYYAHGPVVALPADKQPKGN